DTVELSICDNGPGFDLTTVKGQGVGLLSMQERMRAIGGTLLLKSVPGKGTQIDVCCENSALGAQSTGVS
ncbi:MAG TPA: ATP-binding protein, partial [Ktedonobacteraceae bacterium]